jgi:predicted dehydrogenase
MRIAMVGTGGIAVRHLECLRRFDDVEIVGHVSHHQQRADEAAARFGGRGYVDLARMLAAETPDAVFICAIPSDHGATELCLIERGIPFFVEKPLDADGKTAARIGSQLRRNKRRLVTAVGYHWRAMDTIPELRHELSVTPPHMVLAAWHDSTPPPAWWRNQRQSGGQIVEQVTHLFDIARHLVGDARVLASTAVRVDRLLYPDADVAAVSSALLQYDSGASGIFTATCLLNATAAVHVQFVCEGRLITLHQGGVVYDDGREQRIVARRDDPVEAEDRAFLDAVALAEPRLVYCTYEDALRTHRLCCSVRDAAKRKRG